MPDSEYINRLDHLKWAQCAGISSTGCLIEVYTHFPSATSNDLFSPSTCIDRFLSVKDKTTRSKKLGLLGIYHGHSVHLSKYQRLNVRRSSQDIEKLTSYLQSKELKVLYIFFAQDDWVLVTVIFVPAFWLLWTICCRVSIPFSQYIHRAWAEGNVYSNSAANTSASSSV